MGSKLIKKILFFKHWLQPWYEVWIVALKQNLQTEIHPVFTKGLINILGEGLVLSTIADQTDPDGLR